MTVQDLGRAAWRGYVTDGVPSTGVNQPSKSDIIAVVDAVGAFLNGPWTTGSIPFLSSASAFSHDNSNLFWDATNRRLGVGTPTPQTGYRAHFVNGAADTSGVALFSNNITNPAVETRGLNSITTATYTADNSFDVLAGFGTVFINPATHTQSASHNAGWGGGGYGFGAGTVNFVSGLFGNSGNQGGGAVNNSADLYMRTVINSGGGTLTNYFGAYQQTGSDGVSGVSNAYGFAFQYPSIIGGGGALPTVGYVFDVRGAFLVKHGGSSLPPSSGTTLGAGLQQTWDDNSGAKAFLYGNGGSGYHLLVSDAGAFGTSYDLIFQNNGGNTKAGGPLTSKSPTGGVGYSTGAGGTVSQATSKSTGVTLNKVCGAITTNAAALGAGVGVPFVLTNSAIAATDVVTACIQSGGTANAYRVDVTAVAGGSCTLTLTNITGGSLSESPVIGFAVQKAVTS